MPLSTMSAASSGAVCSSATLTASMMAVTGYFTELIAERGYARAAPTLAAGCATVTLCLVETVLRGW